MSDLNKVDEALKKFLAKTKEKALGDAKPEMQQQITQEVIKSFEPALQQLATQGKITKEDLVSALKEIQIASPNIEFPEQKAPIVNMPAPVVNIPPPVINIPKTEFPKYPDFPSEMSLKGISPKTPLHVQMVDPAGKPMMFPISGGAGGGRSDFFTIKDIQASSGVSIIDQDSGAMKVSGSFSVTASNSSTQAIDSSGEPYSQANPFPVVFSSSGSTASALIDSSGVQYSGSNPLPVTGSFSSSPVLQVSGAADSVNVISPVDNGDAATAVRVVIAGNSSASVTATQSGTWNVGTVTTLTGVTNSIAASNVDSSGVQYSGSNPMPIYQVSGFGTSTAVVLLDRDGNPVVQGPIAEGDAATALRVVLANNVGYSVTATQTGTWTVTGITNTIAAMNIDSTGVGYSGSNPLPVTLANTGSTQNVTVAGATDSFFAYEARTTNPTAKSDGADVRPKADKLGRAIMRSIQVRDLIATAYVALANGTETALATAAAGTYLDLIMITATNNSTAVAQLDIRAVSGGNIIHTMYIPASTGPVGFSPTVPWPQDATGNAWTVDRPDETGSTVYVSALFSREL